jgi:hypothetical protein
MSLLEFNFLVPKTALIMPGGNVIQCFLALSHQWGCFGSLKGFQSHLTVRANTNIFLWPSICLNFQSTGQDRIYLGLETVANFLREMLSLHPQDSSPGSCILDPSVYQTSPLTAGVPDPLVHSSLFSKVTLYLG